MEAALLFTQLFQLVRPETITVLKSSLKIGDASEAVSGAKLRPNQASVDIEDITICMRFNYKLLGPGVGTSQLVHISSWLDEPATVRYI